MATPRNQDTRPERVIPAQPAVGVAAMIDPDLISRPIEHVEPAAIAERTWLERDSMAAAADYTSDWGFFD
jgi:hypothetical protein